MYDEFYKLSGKPFLLTPDHKFFYNSKPHHRAMAYLRYGLEQGEGFIVITGAVGTGKTMLVRNLFKELENKDVMAAQMVTTQVEPEEMLRMVCASFGLSHQGQNKATLLHNLEAVARAHHSEGKRVLLVVDEAQNLPALSVEELRMLSNFQIDGRALFQSFLLGQEEFKRTLQDPGMEQVRQRIIASYHLDPLSEDETKKYINHRLKLVDWDNDPAFDDDAFDAISDYTGGIPRRINSLCDRILLYGCLEELHVIHKEVVATVIGEIEEETQSIESNDSIDEAEHTTARISPSHSDAIRDNILSVPDSSGEIDLLQRLAAIEKNIQTLKDVVQHERQLLRKAILLQLDIDDEYDEL